MFISYHLLSFVIPYYNLLSPADLLCYSRSLLVICWSPLSSPGIYTTNNPAAVRYVVEHSRANILLVEDEEQLAKVKCNCSLVHL